MRKRDAAGREIDAVGPHQVVRARVEIDWVLEQCFRRPDRHGVERRRATDQLVAQHGRALCAPVDLPAVSAVPGLALGQSLLTRGGGERHGPASYVEHAMARAE